MDLQQRRFSLAPTDHGSYGKKKEEILSQPIKIAVARAPHVTHDMDLDSSTNRLTNPDAPRVVDWNAEFQSAVDEVSSLTMNHSPDKRIAAYSKLGKLYQNFIDTATLYGKILISEKYLPENCRTFKACDIGGVAGGEKFLVQNILFKICTDHCGIFNGNEYYAHKLGSHELKGLINIYNNGSKLGLYVPMMCVLMYKGFHMIAMSVLPINNSTLVYGSPDAGRTIYDHAEFSAKLKQVADELGLKLHKVGKEPSVKLLYTPVDMEGHMGTDGRMYLLDFSRLFPPERPDPSSPKYMYLCRLLRPEFVKIYSQMFGPLSSDAYSNFSVGTDTDEADRADINHATEYLLTEHLPLFLERFQRFNAIDPFAWLDLLHTHGINYRHMGALRQLVLRLPNVPNYTNCDTHLLILMAMIARVAKNQLNCIMRAQVKANCQSVPGDQLLKQVAAAFLNVVFGNSRSSHNFWNITLKDKLSEYFPNSLTEKENRDPHFGQAIRKSDHINTLFWYTVRLCGLRLRSYAHEQFKDKDSFDLATPLDESDIEEIKERVQSMSVAAFAEGVSMQMKAQYSTNENEAKRLYRLAKEKLKKALEMEPGNIQALTQMFVNMVQTGHPIVAESIYHSVVYGKIYDSEFLWRYANFCKARGLIERAEVHYLSALDLDPNFGVCLSDYAKFLADTGDIHSAHRFFQRAVSVAPYSVTILLDLAVFLHRRLRDTVGAQQYLERARASPDFNRAYLKGYDQFLLEFSPEFSKYEFYPTSPVMASGYNSPKPPKKVCKLPAEGAYVDPLEG